MTRLTIDLPDEAAQIAAEKARRAYMTLVEWAGMRIIGRRMSRKAAERDAMGYPLGWFDRTTGSLAAVEDFHEPADPPIAPIEPLEL